ncbi:MAG TPA: hypothetical protein VGQ83_19615 [Polyangia bacterium]|jgi:hypothetical protein
MSVDDLTKDSAIHASLARLLPDDDIKLGMRLRIPPRRNSGPLVGTAYDYMVRFELERQHPNALTRRWVAEGAVETVAPIAGLGIFEIRAGNGEIRASVDGEVAARWVTVVRSARKAHKAYVADPAPSAEARRSLACHALRLARIDTFVRAEYVDVDPSRVEPADAEDVLELLEATPFDRLGSRDLLWLNPTFGDQSTRVGGADADIISGTSLLDLKTVKTPTPRGDLRQLLAYLFLARAARATDPSFPAIVTIGIYYSRQCQPWLLPVHGFTQMTEFSDVEHEFFERAETLFPRPLEHKGRRPPARPNGGTAGDSPKPTRTGAKASARQGSARPTR